MNYVVVLRVLAIAIFGVVVPIILLFQAYWGLSLLSEQVGATGGSATAAQIFEEARVKLHDANDYALYSVISAEQANLSVLVNKQIMKISVMQIGFAVISLGIMFVILGFNDGGADTTVEAPGWKIDFKTSSTGAVVFVIGAAMAAAGGILKNDYSTVPIPGYIDRGDGSAQLEHARTVEIFRECRDLKPATPALSQECFYKMFEQEFGEEAK
jgi:hypothetical protein